MPPGVVRQVLRPPVGLPGSYDVEGVVVQEGDPTGSVGTIAPSEARDEQPVRPAVHGVRSGVPGPCAQLGGVDPAQQRRVAGVRGRFAGLR